MHARKQSYWIEKALFVVCWLVHLYIGAETVVVRWKVESLLWPSMRQILAFASKSTDDRNVETSEFKIDASTLEKKMRARSLSTKYDDILLKVISKFGIITNPCNGDCGVWPRSIICIYNEKAFSNTLFAFLLYFIYSFCFFLFLNFKSTCVLLNDVFLIRNKATKCLAQ